MHLCCNIRHKYPYLVSFKPFQKSRWTRRKGHVPPPAGRPNGKVSLSADTQALVCQAPGKSFGYFFILFFLNRYSVSVVVLKERFGQSFEQRVTCC